MKGKTKKQPTLTKEEAAALAQETRKEARAMLAKREKLGIRFTEQEIQRIQTVADSRQERVSTMLHDWVIQMLERAEEFEQLLEEKHRFAERKHPTISPGIYGGPPLPVAAAPPPVTPAPGDLNDALRQLITVALASGIMAPHPVAISGPYPASYPAAAEMIETGSESIFVMRDEE